MISEKQSNNQVHAYLKPKNARLLKAYAQQEELKVSECINMILSTHFSSMPENKIKMLQDKMNVAK
jgi:hypothetical protein